MAPSASTPAEVELKIFQAKSSGGLGEASLNTLMVKLPALLSFDRDEEELRHTVNGRLLEITRRFLYAWSELQKGAPSIEITFGAAKVISVHPNLYLAATNLSEVLASRLALRNNKVTILGGVELWQQSLVHKTNDQTLTLAENALSSDVQGGYVCLVKLEDFAKFISMPGGDLNTSLFEANVRDYEVDSLVNHSIATTLADGLPDIDFWWLNNGVSIVADEVFPVGTKAFRLTNPQVVNGLQTSTELYKFARQGGDMKGRTILVKVVRTPDSQTQENIIKATNSQTALGWGALRATDTVQRNIELYFAGFGWYYERRKNFYRNQQKPVDRIIPMQVLAQSVCSTYLLEPDTARDSVAQLFSDEYYKKIFSAEIPVSSYYAMFQIFHQTAEVLSILSELRGSTVDDWVHNVSMFVAILMTGKPSPVAQDYAALENYQLARSDVQMVFREILDVYNDASKRLHLGVLDKLARHDSVRNSVLRKARACLQDTTWATWGPIYRETVVRSSG